MFDMTAFLCVLGVLSFLFFHSQLVKDKPSMWIEIYYMANPIHIIVPLRGIYELLLDSQHKRPIIQSWLVNIDSGNKPLSVAGMT